MPRKDLPHARVIRHHPTFISGTTNCSKCDSDLELKEIERTVTFECSWCINRMNDCDCEYQKQTVLFYQCKKCATCPICKEVINKNYETTKFKNEYRNNDFESDDDHPDNDASIELNEEIFHQNCFDSLSPVGELQFEFDKEKGMWYVVESVFCCEKCNEEVVDDGTSWRPICRDCKDVE